MSASARRAIVIGGSLAGLFAGLLLRRQFSVDIYERADAELAGRAPASSRTSCSGKRSMQPGLHGDKGWASRLRRGVSSIAAAG
jgi:predicted NAD/FAD-binding protein